MAGPDGAGAGGRQFSGWIRLARLAGPEARGGTGGRPARRCLVVVFEFRGLRVRVLFLEGVSLELGLDVAERSGVRWPGVWADGGLWPGAVRPVPRLLRCRLAPLRCASPIVWASLLAWGWECRVWGSGHRPGSLGPEFGWLLDCFRSFAVVVAPVSAVSRILRNLL